jgi:hypothetical protein
VLDSPGICSIRGVPGEFRICFSHECKPVSLPTLPTFVRYASKGPYQFPRYRMTAARREQDHRPRWPRASGEPVWKLQQQNTKVKRPHPGPVPVDRWFGNSRRFGKASRVSNLRSPGVKPGWAEGAYWFRRLVSKPWLTRREAGLGPMGSSDSVHLTGLLKKHG